ncbi:TonB-dependent receptor [candidate division KSB1 bacterium]|nr:TonB-dependent receptor [candidate division KSB1 bacterium]
MSTKKIWIVLMPALLISIWAAAAETQTDLDSINIKYYFNPVVKTGIKSAGSQRDIAAAMTVIGSAKFEQTPGNSVMEMVQAYVPGLYLTEWNVMGYGVAGSAAGKVSIRGIGGTADTHVMILRNGRPDFMGLMGCTLADEFSTDGVERLEIIRGPASFLYGTNASAGVINIVTHDITHHGFQTDLKVGAGVYNSKKFSIRHSGKWDRTEYKLTASRRSTDGFRTDADNRYEGNYFTGHFAYSISKKTSLELNASFADLYLFDPGLVTTPKTNDWYDILRWGGDLTLTNKSRFGESYLKSHGNFGKHQFADGWDSYDQMIGFMAYHNLKLTHGNLTTLGFDIKQYGGHGENLTLDWQGNPSVPYTEKQIMEYAPYMHSQQLLLKRFILSAGLRIEKHDLYGTVTVPKAGLVTHISDASSIRVTHSKGFRSPSLRELYFFPSHNEDLKPDEFWNSEIGGSYQFGNFLKVDASVYHIAGDNLIALAPRVSRMGYQLSNVGETENNGYEVQINLLPVNGVECGANWSHIDMKNKIPNMPEKKLTAYISGRIGQFSLSANLMWVGNWLSKDTALPVANIYRMDNYTVLDFSTNFQIYNLLQAKLTLKNALDSSYQAMYGYPMPGRIFMAELTCGF